MNRITKIPLAIGCVALITSGSAVANEKAILNSTLDISFAGLPVGTLSHTYAVSVRNYSIKGSIKSNRLVSMVAGTKANFSSSGRISGAKLVPASQSLKYKSRRKKGAITLAFTSGNVRSASVWPKRKIRKGTVPIVADHRRGVIDPVSALVFAVGENEIGNGDSVCNRTLPVFDGTSRYNLNMSFASAATATAKGFRGDVFICNVRYQPIAGHRPHKKNVKFLKANRNMQVTMARIGVTNTYGLFGFRVKTRNGTAVGRANTFAAR
ncbi:MAG: DUF3108 domain-containing protein [Rhizobiaceae bacterium]